MRYFAVVLLFRIISLVIFRFKLSCFDLNTKQLKQLRVFGKLCVMGCCVQIASFSGFMRIVFPHIVCRTVYVKITLVFKTFLLLNSEKTRLVKIMILTGCKLNSFVAPYF